MPLFVHRTQKWLPLRLLTADTFGSRLAGWLGRSQAEADELLHLLPCRSVHTWGMRMPIDVIFLDQHSRIVGITATLQPNRMAAAAAGTLSVLEAPAGFCRRHDLGIGDPLTLCSDGKHHPGAAAWRSVLHWPMNLFIAILWAQLVAFIFHQGWGAFTWLGLGVLLHNSLLMILFLIRRPSQETSKRPLDWIIAFLTLACAMGLRPLAQPWQSGQVISLALQALGISAILYALLSLGRSFGIVPANRTVQVRGAYRVVRHPLYASELVFYAGFLIGHPSLQNFLLAALILAGQIWRALAEETLLMRDPLYRNYAAGVRRRFIPYVF